MELFVVLAFAIGWVILEFVAKRMEKRRNEEDAKADRDDKS